MMPGTIAQRRVGMVKVEASGAVDVSGLTSAERTVALYASDMPTRRRYGSKEQVRAWVAQGVERLGRTELRRRALFLNGHFLLALGGLVPIPALVQARHDERFPDAFRLDVAGHATATSVCFDGMSKAAMKRNAAAKVDGQCPCENTGRMFIDIDGDPDLSYEVDCLVHAAAPQFVRAGR
ncbi:hypothetical protein [Streptomyces brasiliscabiei]|uniref:hypothetical protein n=1 Tax=Streptomyces brasiliscabiei TaxID=2736302 RepID=UPI001F1F6065|nr:hypothetical protein [Streptomyces brasiliscabiei]